MCYFNVFRAIATYHVSGALMPLMVFCWPAPTCAEEEATGGGAAAGACLVAPAGLRGGGTRGAELSSTYAREQNPEAKRNIGGGES